MQSRVIYDTLILRQISPPSINLISFHEELQFYYLCISYDVQVAEGSECQPQHHGAQVQLSKGLGIYLLEAKKKKSQSAHCMVSAMIIKGGAYSLQNVASYISFCWLFIIFLSTDVFSSFHSFLNRSTIMHTIIEIYRRRLIYILILNHLYVD